MKERNYGLDLYRVIAMLYIVAIHFSDHGATFISYTQEMTFNWLVLAAGRVGAGVVNSVFVIISGYYLVQSNFKAKTVIRIYLEVWFFSVLTGLLACLAGVETFSGSNLIRMMMPFSTCEYWFFSAYIVLYLIFPFLNLAIDHMDQKQHLWLIIIAIIVICGPYTIFNGAWFIGNIHFPVFILMYLAGAYFRKYPVKMSHKQISLILAVVVVCMYLSIIVMKYLAYHFDWNDDVLYVVWGEERIVPVLASFLIFLWFRDLKVRHFQKIIVSLSTSVFAVYLFHIGRLNPYLFLKVFNNSETFQTPWFLPQMLLAVVSIFTVGIILDKIRLSVLEKPLMKVFDKQIKMLDDKMQKFYPRRS